MRERRPSLDPELAAEARARAADEEPWRPSPGKVTRTMRLASQMSPAEVHRRAYGEPGDEIADVLARLDASTGAPLPTPLADDLGSALGRDLGAVRVHTDGVAAAAASDLAAEAFAIGDDIYFAAGAYQPHSERGRHLIAHEVAHTAQQRGASTVASDAIRVSEPHDPSELEADRFADAFVARQPAQPSEPARIVSPTSLSMVTPVQRRVIARYPGPGPFPQPQFPPSQPGPAPTPAPQQPASGGVSVDVGSITLFDQETWKQKFTIVPQTFIPIARGLVMVDIVPVTYGVQGKYQLTASADGSIGPGTLSSSVVFVDSETAERLGIGKSPVEDGAHGNSGESNLDKLNNAGIEVQGNANLDVSASASARVDGDFTLDANVGIADIFKVGGSGGLSVHGSVTANASLSPRVSMRWRQGTATIDELSMTVKLSGNISVALNAHAGVYVELSPPDIPILSDVARFINSIPVVEWAIPDPGKYTWRSDLWKKTFPVANKSKDWDLTRTLKIIGSSPSASATSEKSAEPPDFAAMVKEFESEGTGEIPTADGGPEELKEQSGTAAIGAARAEATSQIANAEKEIEREKTWNTKAAEALAKRRAKEASSGSGSTPTVHKAAIGGGGDEEAKLAEHAAALGQATASIGNLNSAANRASQGASSNLPTRAEAKAGLDAVATNADKLGDAVTAGQGKFTRPSVAATADKAAEAAFEARRARVQLRVDAAADPVLAEATWTDAQLTMCDGCPAIADYRGVLGQHQQRVQTLSARLDMVENDLTDAWTTALGGDYAGANAKLDEVERQLGWVEGQTPVVRSQRPKPTWDDRYAAPDGGQLQLRPEFRGIVRETFYPSGYRSGKSATEKTKSEVIGGVKYWRFTSPNGAIQPKHPTDKTLWEYDDPRERPTNDHVPAVAVHWSNNGGNNEDQKSRANAYNGLAGGITLVVIPQALNSSLGSGGVSYTPVVTIKFRGS